MGKRFFRQRIAAAVLPITILLSASSCSKNATDYYITEQTGIGVYHSMEQKKDVIHKYDKIKNDLSVLPVSFTYGGKDFKGFGSAFQEISRNTVQDGSKVTTNVCLEYRKELQIDVILAIYPDYCAYEWTVYFKNITNKNSALLENVNCADMTFTGENPVLKGIYGDGGIGESGPYAPYAKDLKTVKTVQMSPPTGRATYQYFPYFNLEHGDGGTFIAIGWPILWEAAFAYEEDKVHFTAGQQTFSSCLEPGERIRTPLAAFLEYTGREEDRAMNLWRHWFIDCNMRKIDGALFEPNLSGGTSWLYGEMVKATDENQIKAMKKYLEHDIPITYWWMDAGWYFRTGKESLSVWLDTGTWMPDTTRFPSKFKAISDFGAENGVKTLLWFEPEVVRLDWTEHDEEYGIPKAYMLDNNLADFGNENFVQWAVERVSQILTEGGISLYRQDFGMNPEPNFTMLNTQGRAGIRENLYAQGYYKYWDLLIARFPNMMIDSCAAGGGRNDLESMRRAVPLHKTDHDYSNQEDKQAMHQTLFMWLPYFGACTTGPATYTEADVYTMRSSYAPWIAMNWQVYYRSLNWDAIRESAWEWQAVHSYYYSDYYQLTEWSRGSDKWRGWEFFDPDTGGGFFQLFRPPEAAEATKHIFLKGLDPEAHYRIRRLDTAEAVTGTGEELTVRGFDVTIDEPRGSAVFTIEGI